MIQLCDSNECVCVCVCILQQTVGRQKQKDIPFFRNSRPMYHAERLIHPLVTICLVSNMVSRSNDLNEIFCLKIYLSMRSENTQTNYKHDVFQSM